MELVDTKYVDVAVQGKSIVVKIEAGVLKGQIELPFIELLKELAKKTDNKLDDAAVALIENALV